MAETMMETMERHLLAWGGWLQGGRRVDGYPVTNVLHESWLPPSPGMTPTMKVGGRSDRIERVVHGAVAGMSVRMQNTLVVVYVMRASPAEWPERLGCAEATVRQRVQQAKRVLWREVQG